MAAAPSLYLALDLTAITNKIFCIKRLHIGSYKHDTSAKI
jgi:hypothetical protein